MNLITFFLYMASIGTFGWSYRAASYHSAHATVSATHIERKSHCNTRTHTTDMHSHAHNAHASARIRQHAHTHTHTLRACSLVGWSYWLLHTTSHATVYGTQITLQLAHTCYRAHTSHANAHIRTNTTHSYTHTTYWFAPTQKYAHTTHTHSRALSSLFFFS